MNGATALDCANTISRPNARKTTTIGTSQNFFSWRRNWKNSEITRLLFITPSKQTLEMLTVAVPSRIRRPASELLSAPCERVLARQTPDERQRHEDQRK